MFELCHAPNALVIGMSLITNEFSLIFIDKLQILEYCVSPYVLLLLVGIG